MAGLLLLVQTSMDHLAMSRELLSVGQRRGFRAPARAGGPDIDGGLEAQGHLLEGVN